MGFSIIPKSGGGLSPFSQEEEEAAAAARSCDSLAYQALAALTPTAMLCQRSSARKSSDPHGNTLPLPLAREGNRDSLDARRCEGPLEPFVFREKVLHRVGGRRELTRSPDDLGLTD